jgi:hypothetical protein
MQRMLIPADEAARTFVNFGKRYVTQGLGVLFPF